MMYKNELEIDLVRCLRALVRKKRYIFILTVLFFIIGLGITLDVGEDKYTSEATVYAASSGSYSDAATAVTAMNAYLDVAKSYKVSQRAALIIGRSDIDPTDIQNSLSVNSSAMSSGSATNRTAVTGAATIISFYATTSDPELSRLIADAAAESYVIEMANILRSDAVKSLDTASVGKISKNAKIEAWLTRIKFMIIGFVFSCILISGCEVFDSKVRTIRDATIKNQLHIIGIIPDYRE